MTNYIPEQGRQWDDIREEMQGMRSRDLDWRHGRHGAYVWYADDDLDAASCQAMVRDSLVDLCGYADCLDRTLTHYAQEGTTDD